MPAIRHSRYAVLALNTVLSVVAGWWAVAANASLHRLKEQAAEQEASCGMPYMFANLSLAIALGLCAVMALAWVAVARGAWRAATTIPLVLVSIAGGLYLLVALTT